MTHAARPVAGAAPEASTPRLPRRATLGLGVAAQRVALQALRRLGGGCRQSFRLGDVIRLCRGQRRIRLGMTRLLPYPELIPLLLGLVA